MNHWIRILVGVAFFSLALNAWGITEGIYAVDKESKDRANLERAILDSRYHDCVSGNVTRKALSDSVLSQSVLSPQESRSVIAKLKLSQSLLAQAEAKKQFELKALAPRNCNKYANQANPKRKK